MTKGIALAACLAQTGCSLVLDFSDKAIPIDAAPDQVFIQSECEFGEPNNSPVEAVNFDVGSTGPAAICATDAGDDDDYYRFAVPAGITSFTIQISFVNSFGDLDLYVFQDDAMGTFLGRSPNTTDGEMIVCPGTAPLCNVSSPIPEGNYLFEIKPATPGKQNRYDIAITLTP